MRMPPVLSILSFRDLLSFLVDCSDLFGFLDVELISATNAAASCDFVMVRIVNKSTSTTTNGQIRHQT